MRLDGKVIAITGGAGGLGAAIARGLKDEGATIVVIDVPSARLDQLAFETQAVAVAADVRDEASIISAFATIKATLGRLDGLVVTAGIQLHGQDGRAEDVPLDIWNQTIAVNLTGAYLSVKYALPLLTRQDTSSIVLIGSPTGLTMSGAGYTAYSASKAGMMSLGRTLAADYASAGLRANVIVPGTIQTPLIDGLLADTSTREALIAGTPLGRLGRPEDLVGITAWLVSDEASFATGAFFAVDGGLTAR